MSGISNISSAHPPQVTQPPPAPPRRVDSDADHDGSRPPASSGTGRKLDVTA